ncbi:MAG: triose-phosphate isomerase [Candidatus Velthaea sp.]
MKTLVVGNWKMHKTAAEAVAFVRALPDLRDTGAYADAVICPAFTALAAVHAALGALPIGLGAQTMHWAENGAYTGEISALMLRETGVSWVILGHSERRAACGEIDAAIAKKIRTALDHGITPVVAVGETAEEHAAGRARERVVAQTQAAFAQMSESDVARCVVAYEPIWAIGTGNVDHPHDANAVMGAIRASVPGLTQARILYGGSVKPDNIAALVAQPNIDGALVGGASLDPTSFATLVQNARKGAAA